MPLFPHLIYMNGAEVLEELKTIYGVEEPPHDSLSTLKAMLKEQRQWIHGIHNKIRLAPTMPSLQTDYMHMMKQQGYDSDMLQTKLADIKNQTSDSITGKDDHPQRVRSAKYIYAWERFLMIIYLCPDTLVQDCITEPPSMDYDQEEYNDMMKHRIYSSVLADKFIEWNREVKFDMPNHSKDTKEPEPLRITTVASMTLWAVCFFIAWTIPWMVMYLMFSISCYVSSALFAGCQSIIGAVMTPIV